MNSKLLALVMLSSVVGAGLGYSISLPQIMTLQSSVSELESETSALTNDYNNLNVTYNQLGDSYDSLNATYYELTSELSTLIADYNSLNESYVELLRQYEDLLFHYNLINGPASNFTTLEDLQITFTTHRTVYYHKDSISGNVTITYLNGTAFKGTFNIQIQPEFGGFGGVSPPGYDVNGYGEFLVEPPYSFLYGPGKYTIFLTGIINADGYVVAGGHELDGTAVQVEAK